MEGSQSYGSSWRNRLPGGCGNLNQVLADTITLRDMYKKHQQGAGPTFDQLHLFYDKHWKEQTELVDSLAERIQMLGGISSAMAHDVAETTLIPRLPRGRQEVCLYNCLAYSMRTRSSA